MHGSRSLLFALISVFAQSPGIRFSWGGGNVDVGIVAVFRSSHIILLGETASLFSLARGITYHYLFVRE